MPLGSKTFLKALKILEQTKDWFCFFCPKVRTLAKFTALLCYNPCYPLIFLYYPLKIFQSFLTEEVFYQRFKVL